MTEAIKEFSKVIHALALELPEQVWSDVNIKWCKLVDTLNTTPPPTDVDVEDFTNQAHEDAAKIWMEDNFESSACRGAYVQGRIDERYNQRKQKNVDVEQLAEAYVYSKSSKSDKEQITTTTWNLWNILKNSFIAGYKAATNL